MTVFRKFTDTDEESAKNISYNAFLYCGPFTEYPHWVRGLFTSGEMVVRNALIMYIVNGVVKSETEPKREANWQVYNGQWVMHEQEIKEDGSYECKLSVIETDDLRRDFYPIGCIAEDDSEEYFTKGNWDSETVVMSVPVRYSAFRWDGTPHGAPCWIHQAIASGRMSLKGVSLYYVGQPIRPGDWVLYHRDHSLRILSDAEYQTVKGAARA